MAVVEFWVELQATPLLQHSIERVDSVCSAVSGVVDGSNHATWYTIKSPVECGQGTGGHFAAVPTSLVLGHPCDDVLTELLQCDMAFGHVWHVTLELVDDI